jgi:hypothetical protein
METVYNIQECNLPGMSFSHISTSKRSSNLNFQGDTITFNDLTVNIIVDEKLNVYKDIISTLLKMREPYSSEGELIQKNAWIEIQDDNTNTILKVNFHNCFIESVDDLSYSTNNEDEIITCSCTIRYDYYTIS